MSYFSASRFSAFKRHWLSVAFVLGFVTDLILLNKVDDLFDNLILLAYVLLATLGIILFYLGVAERAGEWGSRFFVRFMPFLMQYAFGGLLSGMLIFYGRSGDFIASAPYYALLVMAIIANEVIGKKSSRLLYNLSLYFIGLFSYSVLMVSVWSGQVGTEVFVTGGILALIFTMFLVKLLKFIIPQFLVLQKRLIVFTIGSLFALFNGLYFYNLIPPIPLSLTELSVIHGVERNATTGVYRLLRVDEPWYRRYLPGTTDFTPVLGQGAYCFARVFAPTSISTTIRHRWEIETAAGWQERFQVEYPISSGSERGYRGYSVANNLVDGRWRCVVENQRGQVLGREVFVVDRAGPVPVPVTVVE